MLNLARVMSTVLSNFISNALEEYGNVNDLVVYLIFVHGVFHLHLTSLKKKTNQPSYVLQKNIRRNFANMSFARIAIAT